MSTAQRENKLEYIIRSNIKRAYTMQKQFYSYYSNTKCVLDNHNTEHQRKKVFMISS